MKHIKNKKGFGFVDSGIKILIAVVIGAVLLGGTYAIASETILPTAKEKVESLFNYSGSVVTEKTVKGDFNKDGIVDSSDRDIMTSEILSPSGNYDNSELDLNGDGNVDLLDLVSLKKIIAAQSGG